MNKEKPFVVYAPHFIGRFDTIPEASREAFAQACLGHFTEVVEEINGAGERTITSFRPAWGGKPAREV